MLIQMFDKFKPQFLAKTKIHQNYTKSCSVYCPLYKISWTSSLNCYVCLISFDYLWKCQTGWRSARISCCDVTRITRVTGDCRDVPDMLDESMEGLAKTCGFLFVKSYNVIHIREAKKVFCASYMHRNDCIWSIIVTYIISGKGTDEISRGAKHWCIST